jgi:hypothetical protein
MPSLYINVLDRQVVGRGTRSATTPKLDQLKHPRRLKRPSLGVVADLVPRPIWGSNTLPVLALKCTIPADEGIQNRYSGINFQTYFLHTAYNSAPYTKVR